MPTADTNRMLLSFVKETGFAEDPPTPVPTLQNLRYTSESLGQDTDTIESQEIRADRQTSDVIRTRVSASGDTNHELSFGTFDGLFESALLSDSAFSAVVPLLAAGSATFTAAGQTIAATNIDVGAVVGEWIEVDSAVNAANNGFFKISAVASGVLTVSRGDALLIDEGPTAGVNVNQLSSITNGTTKDSYYIEKNYQDLTNTFASLFGMTIDQLSLDIAVGAVVTTAFSWSGSKEVSNAATLGDGSNTVASTTEVMNSVGNVVKLIEGSGAATDICARNVTLQLVNGLRQKDKIGQLGAFEIGDGQINLTGTVQAFFNDVAIMNSYLNFTKSHIVTRFNDSANNSYILDIPTIKYTAGRRVSGGTNQDIIADLTWTAFIDAIEGISIRLVRRPGP